MATVPCTDQNCPRLTIEVLPTAFRNETLTLTFDLQPYDSYSHDPYTHAKGQGQKLEW